ncbi:uncharacterized protein LOC119111861 isoform X1 [Pollicipes pollicipes]|uniref:uncharacterized protein LOC119111861 isoform X1 n=1 Tax=Pollicipes pollicipes TaxID=41117 RepID=UPI0018857C85|nr:uncharacterized protein LOC119111861 isoform X1 [Pollicipes pollicipes]XP_037091593.1 uncharacterized protein LOC119111861 isoform X1 [Pollicipes pollicipes]
MAPTGRRKRGSCWRTGARRRQGPAVPGAGPACFSRDSVAESETPVFQAFLTTPSEQQRFTFPAPQDTGAGHFDTDPSSPHGDPGPRYPQPATDPSPPHRETEPTRPHWETAPKSPLYETAPKYPYQETDAKYPYQETGPKYPYQETGPKYPDQQTDPKYPYSETDPKYPFSQTDTRYPKQETDPKYPYQETDSKYTYQETFPKYPYQETDPKYPDAERTPPGGRRPVTAAGAGGRRFSEAASPRPRRLDETGRSQSEEGWRLPPTRVLLEQATLESDETGSPGVSSDMRGLHMDVRDSSNVHVGPKVIDQRNIHVARLDSRVDNLHRHEHVQEKHEHIRSKHEHVQNKTEVHSKTENIKHEHIQNKHEYIQVNKTEIVHTNAKAIFADRLYFGYDCSVRHDAAARSAPSSPSRVSLEPRQFQEGRRFLETRYTSWTTLSMPLPWYDDMVLDLSKSCVDFTMVSTGSGSVGTYNGVEQLVREQLGRQQQTLHLPRLYCDAAGFSALAALIRQHVSLKTLDVSVFLVDGPVDLACTSYTQLNRKAMGRNRKMSVSPEAVRKVPLHRAGPGRPHPTADQGLRARSNPDRPRTGPDQELERLNAVLAVNLKDERRVRVVDGIWHLVDQAGSRAMYPLPMCDKMSHRSGYHQLFEAVRSRGARLENLTIGRESLTKQDFVCLGETIRKSESLTALSIANVEKVANIFPLITGLPTARRLESLLLRSPLSDVNDFLFSVFCRCLEDNASLQELNIQQWKFKLESPASVDQLRSLMKNTSVQRLDAADCRVTLACRVDDLTFPCASICRLNLSNCSVETSGDSLRGATLLPLLQGLSALKQLDLSHSAAPPLNDAAVKAFFAGLSSFKTLQELAICGWSYDVTNPEAAYAETKAAARKWSRLTTVRVDKSQFTARAAECGKQWLVQAMATGVPHLQELRFSSLTLAGHATCAITRRQVESLAKAILKAKWTGHALRLYMQQVDPRLVGTFVELTSSSSRIDVTSNGRIVMFKRLNSGQWWRLRPR